MTVFVGNLPFATTKEEIEKLFEKYKLKNVVCVQARGFAFIDSLSAEDEAAMIKDNQAFEHGGRKLIVTKAREKPKRRKRRRR
jgi:RNA recognition motif-containing protein